MASDTSKTLVPLFCPPQQTRGFLTDSQRAVLWDSWPQITGGCYWKDYSALLSLSHTHPPISLWLPLLFFMTPSVRAAYKAKPRESYLCLLPPWSTHTHPPPHTHSPAPSPSLPTQVVVLPKRTHYGSSNSQLKNQSGSKPRPWSNSIFLNIAISLSQLNWFHVNLLAEVIRFDVIISSYYYFFFPKMKYPWENHN